VRVCKVKYQTEGVRRRNRVDKRGEGAWVSLSPIEVFERVSSSRLSARSSSLDSESYDCERL